MNPDVVFVVSSVIIAIAIPASYWAGTHAGHSAAEASIDWLRVELQQANERLFAVSREPGAVIPARTEPVAPPIELPRELELYIGDWESAETQDVLRHQFRGLIEDGVPPSEILRRQLES